VSVPCNPDCLVCHCRHPQPAVRSVSLDDLASLGNVSLEDDSNTSGEPTAVSRLKEEGNSHDD